eukprot:846072-Prorocentrum_minimum.AAC.1
MSRPSHGWKDSRGYPTKRPLGLDWSQPPATTVTCSGANSCTREIANNNSAGKGKVEISRIDFGLPELPPDEDPLLWGPLPGHNLQNAEPSTKRIPSLE